MPDSIVMLGGGGHALVVAEAAALCGIRVVGLYDDHPAPVAARLLGVPRLGGFADAFEGAADVPFILAVGELTVRRKVLEKLSRSGTRPAAPAIVHPRSIVHASATLGRGVYVGPAAVVHSFAVVGDHAIINSGAIVEHECHVGMNAHLAPGAVLGGRVAVGRDALVGLGSRVLPNLKVGHESTVGAGAVVVRDVAAGLTVVGSPARELPVRAAWAGQTPPERVAT